MCFPHPTALERMCASCSDRPSSAMRKPSETPFPSSSSTKPLVLTQNPWKVSTEVWLWIIFRENLRIEGIRVIRKMCWKISDGEYSLHISLSLNPAACCKLRRNRFILKRSPIEPTGRHIMCSASIMPHSCLSDGWVSCGLCQRVDLYTIYSVKPLYETSLNFWPLISKESNKERSYTPMPIKLYTVIMVIKRPITIIRGSKVELPRCGSEDPTEI